MLHAIYTIVFKVVAQNLVKHPRVEFWRFSQNRPPTRVSRTLQNRGLDLHQDGGIAEKTSFRRKNLGRRMRSCTGGAAGQPV